MSPFCSDLVPKGMLLRYQVRRGEPHASYSRGGRLAHFGTVLPQMRWSVITCGMPLPLVVHQVCPRTIATLPDMASYHVLATGTVLWLLASAGGTDSHLPTVLTVSLTAGALLFSYMVRRRREKL